MLIGAIVSIVAFAWSTIRDLTTYGTKRAAEAMLDAFRQSDPYRVANFGIARLPQASQSRLRGLTSSVSALQTALNDTEFWDISLDGVESLLDLEFCPPQIALLTDKDEAEVIDRLRRARRWTAQDRALCTRRAARQGDALTEQTIRRLPPMAPLRVIR